jgi:hypothetical protein
MFGEVRITGPEAADKGLPRRHNRRNSFRHPRSARHPGGQKLHRRRVVDHPLLITVTPPSSLGRPALPRSGSEQRRFQPASPRCQHPYVAASFTRPLPDTHCHRARKDALTARTALHVETCHPAIPKASPEGWRSQTRRTCGQATEAGRTRRQLSTSPTSSAMSSRRPISPLALTRPVSEVSETRSAGGAPWSVRRRALPQFRGSHPEGAAPCPAVQPRHGPQDPRRNGAPPRRSLRNARTPSCHPPYAPGQ